MERMAWTDARLDDRFDRIDSALNELRQDMRELRAELGDTRSELRAEIDRLRFTILTVGGSGFLGLIAAVLATA